MASMDPSRRPARPPSDAFFPQEPRDAPAPPSRGEFNGPPEPGVAYGGKGPPPPPPRASSPYQAPGGRQQAPSGAIVPMGPMGYRSNQTGPFMPPNFGPRPTGPYPPMTGEYLPRTSTPAAG